MPLSPLKGAIIPCLPPRHHIKDLPFPSRSNGAIYNGKTGRGSAEPAPADARGDARSCPAVKHSQILREAGATVPQAGKGPHWASAEALGSCSRSPPLTPIPLHSAARAEKILGHLPSPFFQLGRQNNGFGAPKERELGGIQQRGRLPRPGAALGLWAAHSPARVPAGRSRAGTWSPGWGGSPRPQVCPERGSHPQEDQ